MTSPDSQPSPDLMRRAMADYVRSVHQAYVDAAALLPPAERARLPLVSTGELTVLAVGARNLHVLATTEQLPPPSGQEIELSDSLGDMHWRLRFYDPVIVPGLGLVDESVTPQPTQVRDLLGVRTYLYHLTVPPGSGLTPHHAQHAGTGLAHSHAAAVRDFDSIAALAPTRAALVEELRGSWVAGLPGAQLLLARALAPGSAELQQLESTVGSAFPEGVDPVTVRRALLAALREGS